MVKSLFQCHCLFEWHSIFDIVIDTRVVDIPNPVFENVGFLPEFTNHFCLEFFNHVFQNNLFIARLVQLYHNSFLVIKVLDWVIDNYRVETWLKVSCKNKYVCFTWLQFVKHVNLNDLLVHFFEVLNYVKPVWNFLA